ncbi:FixH family protein [Roseomonas sp. E05]|uniref:FixH family protein n=1 Tax=Roseomonas sp. E05 TaxID=3046310 RepID=UPI0024B96656|nr:FixH family protein [Roseomonas sp. E05]MDJ0388376.1 FixH family protein [Roseomonas sp. E05]
MSVTLPEQSRRSGWIPWAFIGGMGLVLAVNAVLVWAALSTFTGVSVGQAYDRGLAYNDVLAETARQEALGWHASVLMDVQTLVVSVRDEAGQPVAGTLSGVLVRPVEGTRVALGFAAVAPGEFRAAAELPKRGQWEAQLRVHGAGGTHLDIRERVFVP